MEPEPAPAVALEDFLAGEKALLIDDPRVENQPTKEDHILEKTFGLAALAWLGVRCVAGVADVAVVALRPAPGAVSFLGLAPAVAVLAEWML